MNCSGPGATHWMACDCRERKWAERLAGADRALYAERERVVRAELRAASLSCELLDAMQARDRLAERAVTMQLMRDTIEGWATGQPGKMPTAVEDGWSTALSAAVARLAASEKAREAWTETARMHAKNEAYYRDLIVRTLSGTPAAFVSDDGSVQQNVICAKLPELYEASEKAREEADAYAGRANARIADLGERLDATEAVLRDAEKAREEAERERDRAAQIATKEAVIASCDHEDNDVPAEEFEPLRAAATLALAVLTRLADSAAYWSDYDVPAGLIAEVDEAKARLAGVLP